MTVSSSSASSGSGGSFNRRRFYQFWGLWAVVALMIWVYPIIFFGWYLTAEQTTAKITACGSPQKIGCLASGEWRLADGSVHSGRIHGNTYFETDVGTTVPVRADRSRAVADGHGVGSSDAGDLARILGGAGAFILVLPPLMALAVLPRNPPVPREP